MNRSNIYYWKCDRPAAFHGSQACDRQCAEMQSQLGEALREHFQCDSLVLTPGAGQGNHVTWNAEMDGLQLFLRVEDGPENDGYLQMESTILREVAAAGVPVPQVYGCDASRKGVPFAWQALERIPYPDLSSWHKKGELKSARVAYEIGRNIATWQSIRPTGFGPCDLATLRETGELRGLHKDYATYFHLRLLQHLDYLVATDFLPKTLRSDIITTVKASGPLLRLEKGCLVHKDLALWNILGNPSHIAAFIDFDDAIIGDPMDDLSLLACFHDFEFVHRTLEGYHSITDAYPPNHRPRFWLHLLRNLIVKAVIRIGSGYFSRDDQFFLVGAGESGETLRRQTEERLAMALFGLKTDADLSTLDADFVFS